jgi:hypothetical protein
MTQGYLRLVEGACTRPDQGTRRRSITGRTGLREGPRQGEREKRDDGYTTIEPIESEAELFAGAEQVDLAEKDYHDAIAHRNEAQIAYLHEPSNLTHVALEAAKTAVAVALEILDTEVRWLANTRATTVTGLKLKASYASMEGALADSIVEDILQL